MISFLLQKMRQNKWLMLCLLVGNILLVGISSATPMYSAATMTRMIHQAMRVRQISYGIYPAVSRLSFVFNEVSDGQRMQTYLDTHNIWLPQMLDELIVPINSAVRTYTLSSWQTEPPIRRHSPHQHARWHNIVGVQYYAEHIRLVYGRMPSDVIVDGNVIEVIATEAALLRQDIIYDELRRVVNVYDTDDPNIYIRVVGIFEIPDEAGSFWTMLDLNLLTSLLVSESLIQNRIIANYHRDYRLVATWTNIHDFETMSARRVSQYLNGIRHQHDLFTCRVWQFSDNYYEMLTEHSARVAEFNIMLLVLQIPLYFLLALYIYVVSRKILQMEQNDISILKSRGASRKQIFGLYVMQGVFMGAFSFPIGILFGMAVCHTIGASAGFLDFVRRTPLIVEASAQALLFGLLAVLFSFLTMILPVIRFSRMGIIEHKLRKSGKPLWQRYFLDIVCIGASIYGIYNFNIQQELIGHGTRDLIDPVLFISSTLFMLGLGLFLLRLFPYIMKLFLWLGGRHLPISTFTSLIRVVRTSGEEQFIMIFLIFTMTIGIFSAFSARTINLNSEHELRYLGGTNLIFQEHWENNIPAIIEGHTEELIFTEPSFERFTGFAEVDSLTRVKRMSVYARGHGSYRDIMSGVSLMAIETKDFGETIWFRDDFLPTHINHYLNVLSQVPNGVILSANFMDKDFAVGDTITFAHERRIGRVEGLSPLYITNEVRQAVIVGFAEYWPGFIPFTYQNQNLIIANLGYLHYQWGVMPYEVWMRTNTNSNQFFYDFRLENELRLLSFSDTNNAIVESLSDPLLQGTNGILTVNFVIALVVCFVGFLIYWILSIRERVLQFGIFRAMGMSMRNIVAMLINEQFFITLTALLIGVGVGVISALLYVPLVQLAFTNQIIPLLVVMYVGDLAILFIVMGTMIIFCLVALIAFILRIRISQALKLGED